MFDHLNVTAAAVFVFFFALVTVLGFLAARWKSGDLAHMEQWGLGGRQFGPWVTFLTPSSSIPSCI
jgi:solute:Na+ symporter, SSS family